MHFNSLLLQLRTLTLTGLAALSTVTAVLAKGEFEDIRLSWGAAAMIFIAMGILWMAIWSIDFLYYNRLLLGAVTALRRLEEHSKAGTYQSVHIEMSTQIEDEFKRRLWWKEAFSFPYLGVVLFYLLGLFAIIIGILSCTFMLLAAPTEVGGVSTFR